MKKNKIFIIIAVILAVIAAVLIWNNRYLTTIRGEAADFSVWDTASVTKIYLADRHEHETLLERNSDNTWNLNQDYTAHPKVISQLLETLYKIHIRMPVSVSSHDNVIARMAGESTKVEIYQNVPRINIFNKVKLFYHEKKTKVFYVGDATKDNGGTFMLREGADNAFIVFIPGFHGFISTRFSANPDDWRDHTVFHENLADIKSVMLEFGENPNDSFRIDNTGRHKYKLTRLADNTELPIDTLKVLNMLSSFSDLRFEALLNNIMSEKRIDSIKNSPYLHKLTLTTNDGNTKEMTTFTKKIQLSEYDVITEEDDDIDHSRMYALINDKRDFVLVQYYTFDKVLNEADYYSAGNPIQFEVLHYQEIEPNK